MENIYFELLHNSRTGQKASLEILFFDCVISELSILDVPYRLNVNLIPSMEF